MIGQYSNRLLNTTGQGSASIGGNLRDRKALNIIREKCCGQDLVLSVWGRLQVNAHRTGLFEYCH